MDIDFAPSVNDGRLAAQLEDFADDADGLRRVVAEVGGCEARGWGWVVGHSSVCSCLRGGGCSEVEREVGR